MRQCRGSRQSTTSYRSAFEPSGLMSYWSADPGRQARTVVRVAPGWPNRRSDLVRPACTPCNRTCPTKGHIAGVQWPSRRDLRSSVTKNPAGLVTHDMEPEDQELVHRACGGDDASFGLLV